MEIEIEKIRRRKLSGEDFLRGAEYCMKIDNGKAFLKFWEKYFLKVEFLEHIEWATIVELDILRASYCGKWIRDLYINSPPSSNFLNNFDSEFHHYVHCSQYITSIRRPGHLQK